MGKNGPRTPLGRLSPGKRACRTYSIGGWVGPSVGLNVLEKRKTSCLCQKSKHHSCQVLSVTYSLRRLSTMRILTRTETAMPAFPYLTELRNSIVKNSHMYYVKCVPCFVLTTATQFYGGHRILTAQENWSSELSQSCFSADI